MIEMGNYINCQLFFYYSKESVFIIKNKFIILGKNWELRDFYYLSYHFFICIYFIIENDKSQHKTLLVDSIIVTSVWSNNYLLVVGETLKLQKTTELSIYSTSICTTSNGKTHFSHLSGEKVTKSNNKKESTRVSLKFTHKYMFMWNFALVLIEILQTSSKISLT